MRLRLTRNGWLVLALAAALAGAGRWLHFPELEAGAVALAVGVTLGIGWAVAGNPPARAARDLHTLRVPEGEALTGSVTVTNTSRRRRPAGTARDPLAGGATTLAVPAVRARGEATAALTLPPLTRGRYQLGPLELVSTDPLGLARTRRRVGEPVTVWAHPRVHAVPRGGSGRDHRAGVQLRAASVESIELHRLDPYVPGDDLRLVHWATTMRRGTLMVRHPARDHHTETLVVLDTAAASYPSDDAFDEAVRTAASVVLALARAREIARFNTTGGWGRTVQDSGRRRVDLLDDLAALRRGDEPGLSTFRPRGYQGRGATVAVTGSGTGDEVPIRLGRHVSQLTVLRISSANDAEQHPPARRGSAVAVVSAPTSEQLVRAWAAR